MFFIFHDECQGGLLPNVFIQFNSIKPLKQSERQIQNCGLVYSKNTTFTTFHTTHPYIRRAETYISFSHYALVTVYELSQ